MSIEQQIDQLIEIAKEWLTFAKEKNVTDSDTYTSSDLSVWCHFSHNDEHRHVQFELNSQKTVGISFFNYKNITSDPIKIEIDRSAFPILNQFINHAKNLLNAEKKNKQDQPVTITATPE